MGTTIGTPNDDVYDESGTNVPHVIFGNGGNDTITGGNGKDIINGGDGNDIIRGGAGNDFLAGINGNDFISGGAGFDKILGGFDTGIVSIQGNNAIVRNGGDVLEGGAGPDFFKYNKKGSKNDGSDIVRDFEDGSDKLVIYGRYTLDQYDNGTYVNFGGRRGIVVEGIDAADLADDIIDTTPPANVITGEGTIEGTAGDDVITGSAGNDNINAGGGNDFVTGGSGRDVIVGSSGDDRINGQDGKDFLAGQDGNDDINGGNGNDTIRGGADTGTVEIIGGNAELVGGGDVLTGGAGTDFFKYRESANGLSNDGADLVTDFQDNTDKLVVQGTYNLIDVANGTFVEFAAGKGVVVEGVSSADLANDIIGGTNTTPVFVVDVA